MILAVRREDIMRLTTILSRVITTGSFAATAAVALP